MLCVVGVPCGPIGLVTLDQITLTLEAGQTASYGTGADVNRTSYEYDITCEANVTDPTAAASFTDVDSTNNSRSEKFPWQAP